jgi:hypothetical protein
LRHDRADGGHVTLLGYEDGPPLNSGQMYGPGGGLLARRRC